ncbi:dihydroneopterin aldolase [Raineya orbicola]|jgi:dihydroneopterin aldolase|uniref:7,8-dihydroneopterin aldolase n=1 Tax=Raineya orbicola TaxID=2016530 RepID=A0A2N3IJ50_9BACT|nr:dihydroneopterin aldolase [Raineya orbicola]PKQ70362.1 folB: dihydroneopterin aldolase [Raineya orbicola]
MYQVSVIKQLAIISLEEMEFFAYHGFYEEEQKIGNKYSVDVYIEADVSKAVYSDKLADTLNYEAVYQIVAEEMQKPTRLLEHIAQRIIDSILQHFSMATKVSVAVSKFNPPVGGVCRKAKVFLQKNR